jgi:signal transduction histidine kinase
VILNGKGTILIFSTFIFISLLLSLFYYQYHIRVTDEIRELAASDVKSNLEIQIQDLSKLLNENIDSILDNLNIVANNENNDNQQQIGSSELESLAEDTSTDLADSYIWIDEEGKIVWSSKSNIPSQISEMDTNNQEFFSIPKTTLKPSIGGLFLNSKDNGIKWYVSYPIILEEEEILTNNDNNKNDDNSNPQQTQSITNKKFNGIIMALIEAETLGQFLQKHIPEKYEASINLFDIDGNILFSTNPLFTGKDIFSLDLDNPLFTNINDSIISLLNATFYNDNPVIYNIPEKKLSIAYQPVYLDYVQHQQEQKYQPFTILSLSTIHKLANDVSYLLEQERIFSILVILSIFSVNISIALIIMTWNKRLKNIVKLKTTQLMQSNEKLKLANNELKLHDKLQKDFINIAAHELRTPIQVISGYTEMLIEDIQNYLSKNDSININNNKKTIHEVSSIIPRIFTMIKAIDRNSSRLYKLTSDLIDVIQIEQNRLELKKEIFDLNETVDDIIIDFKKLISSEKNNDINNSIKIIFEKSADNSMMMVFADKSKISQIIFNLLSNAVKFTPNGTIIISIDKKGKNNLKTISTGSAISSTAINNNNKKVQLMSHNNDYDEDNNNAYNNEITVKIKDTGSGLSPDIQSRLFEKFSSKSEKGIGLGLYISKKIIEAHNGSIQGENNHDCKGATFTFTLPINCS